MSEPRCVLITDDFLPHIGGSRIYYDNVARILGGQLAVVTRAREDAGAFDSKAPYAIARTPLLSREGLDAGVFRELSDIIRLARATAASFPSSLSYLAGEVNPSAFAAALLSRRRGVPFGIIVHDEPMAGTGRLEGILRRKVLRAARVIVAASSLAASRARELTDDKTTIFYAPPGVDIGVFTPGAPDPAILRREGIARTGYLLCVGRLVEYKNVQAVIKVAADLGPSGPGLVVVGEGPERGPLEKLARDAGVAERVVFAGRAETAVLVQIYRGALAYIFASLPARGIQHEGIGMGVLEAAACGCPAIVSTSTSAIDFVEDGHTGVTFAPLEADSLANAVRRMLSDEALRKSVSEAAFTRVKCEHSWERTAESVSAAIDAMLAPATSRNVLSAVKLPSSERR